MGRPGVPGPPAASAISRIGIPRCLCGNEWRRHLWSVATLGEPSFQLCRTFGGTRGKRQQKEGAKYDEHKSAEDGGEAMRKEPGHNACDPGTREDNRRHPEWAQLQAIADQR